MNRVNKKWGQFKRWTKIKKVLKTCDRNTNSLPGWCCVIVLRAHVTIMSYAKRNR